MSDIKMAFSAKSVQIAFFLFFHGIIFLPNGATSLSFPQASSALPLPPSLLPSLPENWLQASWAELVLRQAGQERGGRESALLSLREWHRWAKIDAPVKILME